MKKQGFSNFHEVYLEICAVACEVVPSLLPTDRNAESLCIVWTAGEPMSELSNALEETLRAT